MSDGFSWLDHYGGPGASAASAQGGVSLLDLYGGPDDRSASARPIRWDQAPRLPEWLINEPYDSSKFYFQQRRVGDTLALERESTRNYRSKNDLFNSQTPVRYVVYADGHGCQTGTKSEIQPKVPTVFANYIGESSSAKKSHNIFKVLLELFERPNVRSSDGTLRGAQFLYLVHLLRDETFSTGSPISVNLPQHKDDEVPDLFLFGAGKVSHGEFVSGMVVRNPAVFMMIDTFTGEVVDLGSKYLTDTYDATPPIVEGAIVSTTSPAYTMRDGRMVQLSDVYNIIQTEMHQKGVRDANQVTLILQSCRVLSDGSSVRQPSPTRGPPKYIGGKKKKQRRRHTRNRKYKLSKKHSSKRR